jgi:hypothetical protein
MLVNLEDNVNTFWSVLFWIAVGIFIFNIFFVAFVTFISRGKKDEWLH